MKYDNFDKLDSKGLSKIQDSAIRAAGNARVKIQIALVATVAHLQRNHDVQVARRLVDGLQETVRGKALITYLCQFGHLTVGKVEIEGKEVETFSGIIGNGEEHAAAVRASFDEAKATMWWTVAKGNVNQFKAWSLDKALQNLIASNERKVKKAQENPELAAQVDTEVSDKTMQAVLAMCNFDAIIDQELAKVA